MKPMLVSETVAPPDVDFREYKRLLGFPPEYEWEERPLELARASEGWYRSNGRPWVYVRPIEELKLDDDTVFVDGVELHGVTLRHRLQDGVANGGFLVAVSAGVEAELEARRRWEAEYPDEYYFLEAYASAVVEKLVMQVAGRLCAQGAAEGFAVLPHYSPGYQGWALGDQVAMMNLLRRDEREFPGPLDVLESGMLVPKKSQLALFGATSRLDLAQELDQLIPCRQCGLRNCRFRRLPYEHAPESEELVEDTMIQGGLVMAAVSVAPQAAPPVYEFPLKTLRRWSEERLELQRDNGSVRARFHLSGSTCNSGGIPLEFQYGIELRDRGGRWIVEDMTCAPLANDDGYKRMCEYLRNADALMQSMKEEKPMLGMPLDAVFEWRPDKLSSGCLCGQADRMHKWTIVLQTLHWRLAQNEQLAARA